MTAAIEWDLQTEQFSADTDVWVNTQGKQVPGTIVANSNTPRLYIVSTPSGEVRRNCYHITEPLNDETTTAISHHTSDTDRRRRITRSQTGTQIRPPDRLNYILKKGRSGVICYYWTELHAHTYFVCNLVSVFVSASYNWLTIVMMYDIICSCMDAYLYIVCCTCYLFILLLISNNCE